MLPSIIYKLIFRIFMNKVLKLLMLSLLVASAGLLQASSAARTGTGTFAAGDIATELNSGPIVISGSQNIPYQHDPIAEGKGAFQGDIVDATPSGAKFLRVFT